MTAASASFTEDLLVALSNMEHSLSTTILKGYIYTRVFQNRIKYSIMDKIADKNLCLMKQNKCIPLFGDMYTLCIQIINNLNYSPNLVAFMPLFGSFPSS